MTMRKFLFPRIHGPYDDLCIRSIHHDRFDLGLERNLVANLN